MKRKFIRLCSLFLCVFMLLCILPVPAFSNSAQTRWEGVDATGAIVTGEVSPIVVEQEILTFDIQEFPKEYYHTQEELLSYTGKVTAEYTFYNPADYAVTATLLFPFGNSPDYLSGNVIGGDDRYEITVDGRPIERQLRHSLSGGYGQFQLEQDLGLLHDSYVEDVFFTLDTPVTKYTFEVNGLDTESTEYVDATFDLDPQDLSRRIYFHESSSAQTLDNGKTRIGASVQNGQRLEIYVMGAAYEEFPAWSVSSDDGDGAPVSGNVSLVDTQTTAFLDFALTCWTESCGVSQVDWYNAMVSAINQMTGNGNYIVFWDYGMDLSRYLMRWYEYEITMEPGQRIVNQVTAPIYPAIDMQYDPAVYGYTYLLSPAQRWAEFGSLDIIINTPFYMLESSTEAFEWTDPGYRLHLEGLPEGELEFTLCAEKETGLSEAVKFSALRGYGMIFFPVAVIILGIVGIVAAIVLNRK